MQKLSETFVEACLNMADAEKSKITDFERQLYGQSSVKIKTLLNNLCGKDNTRYLELGIYRGSTLVSAAFGNTKLEAVGVENFKYDRAEAQKWSEEGWPNMKSNLYDILEKYSSSDVIDMSNIKIIESDFQDIVWSAQPKLDVIFFDIEPVTEEIYDVFFKKVVQAFTRQCVVIFSQYSKEDKSKMLEAKIEQYSDRLVTEFKLQRVSSSTSDSFGYHSGLAIYGFRKKAFAKHDD